MSGRRSALLKAAASDPDPYAQLRETLKERAQPPKFGSRAP